MGVQRGRFPEGRGQGSQSGSELTGKAMGPTITATLARPSQ